MPGDRGVPVHTSHVANLRERAASTSAYVWAAVWSSKVPTKRDVPRVSLLTSVVYFGICGDCTRLACWKQHLAF